MRLKVSMVTSAETLEFDNLGLMFLFLNGNFEFFSPCLRGGKFIHVVKSYGRGLLVQHFIG